MPADLRFARARPLLVVLLTFSLGGLWSARAAAAVVSNPDSATTPEDRAIEVEVLENDTQDLPGFGSVPAFDIARRTQPANGSVEINARPGFGRPDSVTYTPRANFSGTDTFTYVAVSSFEPGVEGPPTTVTITVTPVNDPPNAVDDSATTGQDRAVTISVLANDTDPEGDALTIASVSQPNHGTAAIAGNAVTYTPAQGFSGTDRFDYRARDATATSAPATVTVVVTPNVAPTARITGGNRTIPDSDRIVGEDVHLDGSTSSDPDGTIASYMWFNQQQPIGSGPTIDVRLADGDNVIRLVVTDDDNASGSSTATIAVAMPPPRASLQDLPDLTPNQRSVAVALDDLCLRLSQQSTLTEEESDLLARCNGIVFDNDPARQTTAVSELGAQDLNAIKSQTLILARSQSAGVLDRLLALRSGADGLSAAPGLSLIVNGQNVPLNMLRPAEEQSPGFDEIEREPLFGERWGFWMRGSFGSSDKESSSADQGFDSDQWGLSGGVDYRIPEQQAMAGLAIGIGNADTSFNPSGEGGVDMSAWSVSLYGGVYPADSYVYADGFLSYGRSSIDSERRIHYTDADGEIDRTAKGATNGSMLSAGVSMAHDFLLGQVTVSPTASLYLIDASVDGFQETGASGLDLAYEKQDFESATASVGVRITGAFNLGWVVLLPHFRGDAVWEFRDDANAFGVRFANDPFAGTAEPTPPIVVTAETADQSYMVLAVGAAAQFRYGISAYVDYQRLEGLEFMNVENLMLGMRVQYSFR